MPDLALAVARWRLWRPADASGKQFDFPILVITIFGLWLRQIGLCSFEQTIERGLMLESLVSVFT